ncbi:hypothetical protein [Bacillus fonticola]|uniref:hypothetical protein n=1 Tax=Bacillus fonticola TaxID=2728853 RepID=UPI0014767836|nr:hypothetical protein [Bacillus fonticola]
MVSIFFVFAVFFLYSINNMTASLIAQREIPEDRHGKVFRTINVLVTILLVSSYIEILFT